ncbi:MAG: TetR/AcrR family transcriptional regulator [Motiliproteus sp.]
MNSTRQLLIDSMKDLLWERGYDATSPNLVLERSGAGKGSFYHHFKGKKELAIAAMDARADELIEEFELIFSGNAPWLNKLEQYLLMSRDGLKGCRMGRIAQDPSMEDALLRVPMKRYFNHAQQGLQQLLRDAQNAGQLSQTLNPQQLSVAIISVLQGGFVISRALNDRDMVNTACQGLMAILKQQSQST